MTHSAALEDPARKLDALDPILRPASVNQRAATSVLIAVARAGQRLVAVGEGGVIVTSDDDGRTWTQAKVPVSVTLTAVTFVTPELGWAVGHSGVVLGTRDGGRTWLKQLDGLRLAELPAPDAAAEKAPAAPGGGASDPLLDVYFADPANGFAIGAFGTFLRTRDGGKTWERWQQHLPNPDGNHLYGIRPVGESLYIVGERGSVYVSKDGGDSFAAVKTPFEGSFFGLAGGQDGVIIAFGLQGRAYASADAGQTWTGIDAGVSNAWTGATVLPDRRIVLVAQGGEVVTVNGSAGAFQSIAGKRAALSAVAPTSNGDVVAVGPRGVTLIAMPAAKEGSGA
jgi:photosystem II stability/assembly factor-like uncharacterized protein